MARRPPTHDAVPEPSVEAVQRPVASPATGSDSSNSVPNRYSRRQLLVSVLIIVEVCALAVLEWPSLYNFNKFAFWDWGGYLVANGLLHHGRVPIVDFGWQYGLLPLFIQEIWFGLAGASPASFMMLSIPCALLLTLILQNFIHAESGAPGHALLAAALPFIVGIGADLPHALEPILISAALLMQAHGRRPQALAMAAAACFVKPSMGYLLGLTLLILILADLRRRKKLTPVELFSAATPALCAVIGLSLLMSTAFGRAAVIESLVPISGAKAYKLLHFGWTGNAWRLFYFPGVHSSYYLGTPVAFWVCASLFLIIIVFFTARRSFAAIARTPANFEVVVTCAILHFGFLAFFYGSPSSWTYYAYILVIGVAAVDRWRPLVAKGVLALCILAALGNYGLLKSSISDWRIMRSSAATAGLYAVPAETAEWERVAAITKEDRPALFTWTGGAAALFLWLRPADGAFVVPGVATVKEIGATLQSLRSAKVVIVPTIPGLGNPISNWPGSEFDTALAGKSLIYKGVYFEVYKETPDSAQ